MVHIPIEKTSEKHNS